MADTPALHNDYARLVGEFIAAVTLAEAVLAANPDAESAEYEASIHAAQALYHGLNEVHSSLELLLDNLPGGRESDDLHFSDAQLSRFDKTADRVVAWQRQISKVMTRLNAYADSEFEPKDARPLIDLLRTLPQHP